MTHRAYTEVEPNPAIRCVQKAHSMWMMDEAIPELVRMALLSQATLRNGRTLGADQIETLYEAMI